jgi:hypothetical protein
MAEDDSTQPSSRLFGILVYVVAALLLIIFVCVLIVASWIPST